MQEPLLSQSLYISSLRWRCWLNREEEVMDWQWEVGEGGGGSGISIEG